MEKTFYLAAFAVTLSSCTRAVSDKTRVTVMFPDSAATSSKITAQAQSVGALATSKWQVAIPSATALNCFAISVKMPEESHGITCNTLSGTLGTTDLIFGGFTRGIPAEIEITPGPGREISLIGFYTDDVTKCTAIAETGGTFPLQNFSAPVYLSKVVKDIQPGVDNVELTIPADLADPEVKFFEECSPKAFGPAFNVTATVTGIPASATSATGITATVGGANVVDYKYSIDPSTTCETASYSPFRAITDSITESGLADGVYSICVIGRTSGGDIQTTPTKKSWTVDTTSATATGITLASAVGSNSMPPITITGTSVGDTVQVFKGPSACMNPVATATATSSTTLVSIFSTPLAEGNNFITAQITDSAGNTGSCSSSLGVFANYNLDTIAPSPVPEILNNVFGTSLYYTPLFTWAEATDDNSGILRYEVAIDGGSWIDVSLSRYYFGIKTLTEAGHYVRVRAVDAAGNTSAALSDTFTVDNSPIWRQQAYGKAVNASTNQWFGYSVAVDGDFMVVGAPFESSSQTGVLNSSTAPFDSSLTQSGAAYVYYRDRLSGAWVQSAYLKAPNPVAGDSFGKSVAISRNTIVIGAPNETSTSKAIVNSTSGDSTITTANEIGAVYVFVFDGTNWKQQSYLKPPNSESNTYNWFGYSVAIDNDIIVAGAPLLQDRSTGVFETAPAPVTSGTTTYGGAYIFERTGTDWAYTTYLKPLAAHTDMRFGDKVAISQDTVVVGAPHENSASSISGGSTAFGPENGSKNGAAYVFKKSAEMGWQQEAYLKAPNTGNNDYFGMALDIFEDRIVIGAKGEDSNNVTGQAYTENDDKMESGAAYVFKRTGTTWNWESSLKPTNIASNQNFGSTVAIWGSSIVVGAAGEASCASADTALADTDTNCANSGAVFAYQLDNLNNWNQAYYFKASNNNTMAAQAPSSTAYGESGLDINGATIAIGNYKEAGSSNAFQNNSLAAPNLGGSSFSGSVYIYFPY